MADGRPRPRCLEDGDLRLAGRFVHAPESSVQDMNEKDGPGGVNAEGAAVLAAPVEVVAEIGRVPMRGDEVLGLINGVVLSLGERRATWSRSGWADAPGRAANWSTSTTISAFASPKFCATLIALRPEAAWGRPWRPRRPATRGAPRCRPRWAPSEHRDQQCIPPLAIGAQGDRPADGPGQLEGIAGAAYSRAVPVAERAS